MREFSWFKLIFGLGLSALVGATALLGFGRVTAAQGPGSPWRDLGGPETQALRRDAAAQVKVQQGRYLGLDLSALVAMLDGAPLEGKLRPAGQGLVLSLPMPDGASQRFLVVESPVMAPGLAAKYPAFKTYLAQGLDDPSATARLDVTALGFHSQVLSTRGAIYIDPLYLGRTDTYVAYNQADLIVDPARITPELQPKEIGLPPAKPAAGQSAQPAASHGTQLRTYRLAVAATGEYTAFFGGTKALGQAAIVTAVNRVDGIYEKEVAVRFVLVANNDALVYTDAATDPYTNDNGSTLLGENQTNLDALIGSANYDVGHVFSTGGGGLANLRVPCVTGQKARGVTGSSAPTGDAFWVDYVAHEMGHEFGGNHTFNSQSGSCSGNRETTAAYEPGSGSTIMAYAGICPPDDLQPHSDPYFHSKSFEEITGFITSGDGNSCPVITPTGNTPPLITSGTGGVTIPKGTPFILTGAATDANNDALTYQWEEYDLGLTPGGAPNVAVPPYFRSFNPSTDPFRIFPQIADIVNNTTSVGEILPSTAAALNFRLTVRDNRADGGGVTNGNYAINVSGTAGPFKLTAPNTAVTWPGGTTQTVTWDVANTDAAPVSCSEVSLSLSTDGGFTYPTPLLANTPNDGAQTVTVPNLSSTTARVRVMCAGNIFFDISDANFILQAGAGLSLSQAAAPSPVQAGTPLTYSLNLQSAAGSADATGVVLTDTLPAGAAYVSDSLGCAKIGSAPDVLRCELGGLASGAAKSFQIRATAPLTAGIASNTAVFSSANGVQALNSPSSLDTPVFVAASPADLALVKSGPAGPVPVGSPVSYQLQVTNAGPNSASGISLADTLPAGMSFVSASPGCSQAAGVVTCGLAGLSSGGSATLTVTLQADTSGIKLNQATVTAASPDSNPANNTSQVSTLVAAPFPAYDNNFSSPPGSEWSTAQREDQPAPCGTPFLGQFNNDTATLTLTGLPAHTRAMVLVDLLVIRSWDGFQSGSEDYWNLSVDGAQLFESTFSNVAGQNQDFPTSSALQTGDSPAFTGASQVNQNCFSDNGAPMDALYPLAFTFNHTGSSLTLSFAGRNLDPIDQESWGLRHVQVLLSNGESFYPYQILLPVINR